MIEPKVTKKIVAHFDIPYLSFLDSEGRVLQELPQFAKDVEHLKKLYRSMVTARVFDAKSIVLQRTGKLGTYPSVLGQEALGVGMGAAMKPEDVLCPYYREVPAQIWRGVSMLEVLLYWGGEETGSSFKDSRVHQDFPICVPIGSQTLHAVGVATAFKIRKEPRVAVASVGDGGTSRGDFYEAVNLAGVWNLPVVFVINNNQWAISVPRSIQSAAETLAQKGIAGGLASEQVDGNDVIAVQYAIQSAMERAREGRGASVIEALTYRMGDHTTADDAKRYRNAEELQRYQKQDPLMRLKNYLISIHVWDEQQEQVLQKEVQETVAHVVAEYQKCSTSRKPETMFDYLYETLPDAYKAQREEVARLKEIPQHG